MWSAALINFYFVFLFVPYKKRSSDKEDRFSFLLKQGFLFDYFFYDFIRCGFFGGNFYRLLK